MILRDSQAKFTADVAKLITWANNQPGVSIRLNECARTISQQILYYAGYKVEMRNGLPVLKKSGPRSKTLRSKHINRLAVDIILDINGIYQTDTEKYRLLGDFWESLDSNNVWGGRFGDGNHFERKDG